MATDPLVVTEGPGTIPRPAATFRGRPISFAQNGEDVILARALRPEARLGTWIDVGAHDPLVDSVTAYFSARGWSGINIEPLPTLFGRLVAQRPADTNLQLAVGAAPGTLQMLVGPPERTGWSTLDLSRRDELVAEGFTEHSVEVRTLASVLSELQLAPIVDFMKVDVEGLEAEVLAGMDFSAVRPRVVVVEATKPGSPEPAHERFEPIVVAAGYRCVLFEGLNRYYVDTTDPEVRALEVDLGRPAGVFDDYITLRQVNELAALEAEVARLTAELEERTRARPSPRARSEAPPSW